MTHAEVDWLSERIDLGPFLENVVRAGPMPSKYGEDSIQIILRMHNDYGASIVRHRFTYGNEDGLFELAVAKWVGTEWSIVYDTRVTNDVLPALTNEDALSALHMINEL